MTSTRTEGAAAASIGAGLALRKRDELLGLLRPCFARTQPWLQAGKYVSALVSELPRVNGWSIARHGRDRTPDRAQRLPNLAVWDTSTAMGVVRRFVPGMIVAEQFAGHRFAVTVGTGVAVSVAGVMLVEYLALSRLVGALTSWPGRQVIIAMGAAVVLAAPFTLISPERISTTCLPLRSSRCSSAS